MKTVKTWILSKRSLDESDSTWITSNSDDVKIKHHTKSVIGYGWEKEVPVSVEIFITTSCEKQESMLHLKYGDRLKLYRVFNYADSYVGY